MPMCVWPFIARIDGTVTFFGVSTCAPWWAERARNDAAELDARRTNLQRSSRHRGTATISSRSVNSGSKRYVVLRSFFRISNLLDELIEMLGLVNKVDLGGIHHEKRGVVVPVEVVRVRLAELP